MEWLVPGFCFAVDCFFNVRILQGRAGRVSRKGAVDTVVGTAKDSETSVVQFHHGQRRQSD
jgi:hypothetical protein